jgi:hypothetical protein
MCSDRESSLTIDKERTRRQVLEERKHHRSSSRMEETRIYFNAKVASIDIIAQEEVPSGGR